MSENLIAYMTWNRLVAWKILSLKISKNKGRLIPLGYGSRQKIFSKYGKAKNTIWVFSIPTVEIPGRKGSYKYRPTLVAKIKIKDHIGCDNCDQLQKHSDEIKKLFCQWGHVAIADEKESEFYELNDATKLLVSLEFQSSKGKSTLFDPPFEIPPISDKKATQQIRLKISQRLESIRRLSDSNDKYLQDLIDHAEKISKQKIFISYAHGDSRETALQLADHLLKRDWSPWLDSLAIPPKKKGRSISSERLLKLLDFGIRDSAIFVAWITKKYMLKENKTDFRWTLKELQLADDQKKGNKIFSVIRFTDDLKYMSEDTLELKKNNTELLASDILDRWEKEQNLHESEK